MIKNPELEEVVSLLDLYLDEQVEQEVSIIDVAKWLQTINKYDEDLFLDYIQKLPADVLGGVALELPESYLKEILEEVSHEKLTEAIEELESDDATDLLQDISDIDKKKANELIASLDDDYQEEIRKLQSYEDDQAGAYMQTEVFKAKVNEKLEDAIKRLRKLKLDGELENIHQVFVVNNHDKLLYAIWLEDLITLEFHKTFKELIKENGKDEFIPFYVYDNDPVGEVVKIFEGHGIATLAVVDKEFRLLGRITSDDVHDFIQESATEQLYNLAGVNDEAEEESTLIDAGKARAKWLLVNLITVTIASSVIGIFDETIQSFVALAVLMPIVAAMGGNTGTQALTVMVRRLALGEIDLKNAKEVLIKESSIALINGVVFGLLMGIIAFARFGEWKIGVIIALAMLINFLCAGFFGSMIPLFLKKIKADPAVGSSVLLTGITDTVGFFSFLGLATWVLM